MPDAADSCALAKLDEAALAWAAGFFDGEGSTMARRDSNRPGYRQLQLSLPQSGRGGDQPPEVLTRFQKTMLEMGHVDGPTNDGTYAWRTMCFEEAQAAIALLWRFLGPVKRRQATASLRLVVAQYAAGAYEPRRSRRRGVVHTAHALPARDHAKDRDLERAWAAGFLDAEGSFGLIHAGRRKNGPDWYRIRVSVSQHGSASIPAEVLQRLRSALGGIGRIERHGDVDDFKWLTEGSANVGKVLAMTRPWLGEVKVAQARRALELFLIQPRLKGDAVRCLRGHVYDVFGWRGGRFRRLCGTCKRRGQRRTLAAIETKMAP